MTLRRMSEIVKHQNPLTLPTSAMVKQACEHMRDRCVGAVLVTDKDRHLLGIFTGRDAVCRVLAEGKVSTMVTLGEVMTRDPIAMPPGKNAIDALRLMQEGGFDT